MAAEFDWTAGVCPTTYGTGPFHPAVRNGKGVVWYWPNITFATENEAYSRATACLADAIQPAAEIVAAWNIYKV